MNATQSTTGVNVAGSCSLHLVAITSTCAVQHPECEHALSSAGQDRRHRDCDLGPGHLESRVWDDDRPAAPNVERVGVFDHRQQRRLAQAVAFGSVVLLPVVRGVHAQSFA